MLADNDRARAFYDSLGFRYHEDGTVDLYDESHPTAVLRRSV